MTTTATPRPAEPAETTLEFAAEREWAEQCGIEFRTRGDSHYGAWELAEKPVECDACHHLIGTGRAIIHQVRGGEVAKVHTRCATIDDRRAHWSNKLRADRWSDWPKDFRPATQPTPASAAKKLDKLNPADHPRFTVERFGQSPMGDAAQRYNIRRDAGGVAPAAPSSMNPKRNAPKVDRKLRKPIPAPAAPKPEQDPRPAPAPAVTAAELPAVVEEWLAKLVYPPKAEFARAYVAHKVTGAPAPEFTGAEWESKATKKADRILAKVA